MSTKRIEYIKKIADVKVSGRLIYHEERSIDRLKKFL